MFDNKNLSIKNSKNLSLFALVITLLSLTLNNRLTHAKSVARKPTPKNNISFTQNKYLIAQNFSSTKFDREYYLKLAEADRFGKQGNIVKVKQIQSQIKPHLNPVAAPLPPQVNLENLSPAGKVYWRVANEGIKQGLKSKIFVPLTKLTETSPDFIPGHLLLVEAYEQYEENENALSAIERLAELYPEQSDVLDKKIELLAKNEQHLEASISARQFAITYPDHQKATGYLRVAYRHKQIYMKKLRNNTITSAVIGTVLSSAADGESGLAPASLLLMGEAKAGNNMAEAHKQTLPIFQNNYVNSYVDRVGQKLAKYMGRNEFEYEFIIVKDDAPNAFALPGGKIFINTGMLQIIGSEAELAGVLSHEIAHSVLSHSFQKIAARQFEVLPFADLINADTSRNNEKEADILGTRVLAAAGYSADGLYNVMAKLKHLEKKASWSDSLLSTHPATEKRMNYLSEIIQRNGYNRYGYEGVEDYDSIFTN